MEGGRDPSDLLGEIVLQADERLLGAYRLSGYGQPLDHLIRVTPQQYSILERGGLALGGVAHGVSSADAGRSDGAPFLACREPRSAAAAQTALGDLFDDRLG